MKRVATAIKDRGELRVIRVLPKLEDVRALTRAKKELSSALASVVSICMELGKLRLSKSLDLKQQEKLTNLKRERIVSIGMLSGQMANIATILKREPENLEARQALKIIQRHPAQAITDGAKALLEIANMLADRN